MERICPFLALEGNARTAVAGYDPEHRCRAVRPEQPLARQEQLSPCLDAEHRACPRYVAAVRGHGINAGSWPPPAPDAEVISTRIVLGPEAALRGAASRSHRPAAARWALGASLGVLGVAAVATGVTGAIGSLPSSSAIPAASVSPSITATLRPAVGGPSPRPQPPSAAASPTAAPATPRPTRRPTPGPTSTPVPQARTYVVQPGDTLAGIASRYGTSVAAIQQANGLGDSDVILIGQVLLIP